MSDARKSNRWKPPPELRALYLKRSEEKYPERRKASTALRTAILSGKVQRPTHCEFCGKECKPHGHHSSYAEDMWLMVTWLCSSCHGEVHRQYP